VTDGDKAIVKSYMDLFIAQGMDPTEAKRKAIKVWLETREELPEVRFVRNPFGTDRGPHPWMKRPR
jgi:hypothetical protein